MDEKIYLMDLYDLYEELLNDKQKEYFKYYYFDNLSLGEIAEIIDVSRNAVHKNIKMIETKLKDYEIKLKLYYKNNKLNKIIDQIEDKKIKQELEKLSW